MAWYRHQAIDFDEWPRNRRTSFEQSNFKTKYSATETDLHREVHFLKPRTNSVVLKTFHSPYNIRQDGQLRQGEVRAPEYPGVILEFDSYDPVQKKYVTISFVCDTYRNWKDNVRAIALGMESLRRVERFGITSKQEQYEGFKAKALPPSIQLREALTPADAQAFIMHKLGLDGTRTAFTLGSLDQLYKQAAANCHPDRGGSHDDMAKLNLARDVLRAHFEGKGVSA